ncbi:FLYWCH zinc finger domain-containing protein [Phthorimaea operculella]|nr:FLYWCH zinc finger domain-containing protein [Phthorimaea operculella]
MWDPATGAGGLHVLTAQGQWPSETAHFITTARGFPMLQIGKYRYGLKTGYKGPRKRWVCGLWCRGCRASVVTIDDEIVMYKNDHNH